MRKQYSIKRNCAWCKEEFIAHHGKGIYHSTACRARAWRKKTNYQGREWYPDHD